MTELLPIRPDPAPGEDLYSLAERTAVLNGVRPAALGLTPGTLARRSANPAVVKSLGAALGLSPSVVRAMTVDVYPRAVTGRPGKSQARSWRLPGVRWTCPRCTSTTGIYLRDWQLALHPLCVACPSLLERTDDARLDALPPDRRAVATQRRIADTLAKARIHRRYALELRRLYALITLVALTADDEWPLLLGWEAEIREALTDRHSVWTKVPAGRPAHAVVLVMECSRALENRQTRRRLVQEGWERLSDDPALAKYAERLDWNGLLPDINADGPSSGIPVWDVDAWRRYRALAQEIADLQERTGLRGDHIPVWDRRQGEVFAPPDDCRAQRVELAVVTHMLVSGAVHNRDTERRSRVALGVTGSGWTTRRLAHGRGIATRAAHDIRRFVYALVEDGLVDYAERRQHLAEAPGLARHLHRLFQLWNADDPVPLEAVETWIWVAITCSPPVEDFLLDPALELDRRLDPEQRLLLHQTVEEYLTDTTRPALLVAERGDVVADRGEAGA
ncbi:TniQ family protein [Cellulomonas xiejunii]|uniref:TniQ family protein n=1 Tax=Cellulomonas xiejunii TaxID=2968083 RepID=A0ABY5KNA8_9CELL|nr:TniQ family protein [Cellulomonas xiejunii]MCC2321267.1 TniQ family protein [Cellulomonas xiejunii]UUI71855.1 TniQ family protein [Cellulomonas xiejunii]